MLQILHLKNVGPAPEMYLHFGLRLNIITGDNGLGKSFILDVVWWALTGTLDSVRPLPDVNKTPEIMWKSWHSSDENYTSFTNKVIFNFTEQEWNPVGTNYRNIDFLIIHSKIDGQYAVLDCMRHEPFSSGFIFNSQQIWHGLTQNNNIVCRGLVHDWVNWQKEDNDLFKQLQTALEVISSSSDERLTSGELTEIVSVDGNVPIPMPTLKMPYGQEIPITLASAGIKRVISLAYMLVWAWKEHLNAAKLMGNKPTKSIVLLFDELEEHLHPRWQHVILKSILEVAKSILGTIDVNVQIIATTHSPFVMQSLETVFDAEKDAWFDLDFDTTKKEVVLEKREYFKRGSLNNWVTSEAFDLPSSYTREAKQVMDEVSDALKSDLTLEQAKVLNDKLLGVLGDIDIFWSRWNMALEQRGLVL
jgi:hypothetical protein